MWNLLLTIEKKAVLVAKTMLTTTWHASPRVAVLVFKKDVLVSELAGVKAVETKTKTKTQKATQTKEDVLMVLLAYRAVAERSTQKVIRNTSRVLMGQGDPDVLVLRQTKDARQLACAKIVETRMERMKKM